MTKYVTLKLTMLSFLTPQDQVDVFIEPGSMLEFDGSTIWLLRDDKRHESITTSNFISIMVENGTIAPA